MHRVPSSPKIAGISSAFSVGGPIKQDKLFFFFSYDQQKRNFPGAAVPSNPAAFLRAVQRRRTDTLASRGITAGAGQRRPDVHPEPDRRRRAHRRSDAAPPEDRLAHQRQPRAGGQLQPAALGLAGRCADRGDRRQRGVESWGNDGVEDDWVIGRFTSVLGPTPHQRGEFPVGPRLRVPEQPGPAIPGEPVVPRHDAIAAM